MGLERFLLAMRADLAKRCIADNPAIAEILQGPRQGGVITSRALDILLKSADASAASPKPNDLISQWFRPLTTKALSQEHIHTLSDLTGIMVSRGPRWWRGLRRIGIRRAQVMHTWVARHEHALGSTYAIDLVAPEESKAFISLNDNGSLAPIDRLTVPEWLDGSRGINRDTRFNYINAVNDLQAINSYLHRFRDRPHTLRAYTKEIERFLFWCILELGKPLSSVLVPDCESYKDFLQAPSAQFVGMRAPRTSARGLNHSTIPHRKTRPCGLLKSCSGTWGTYAIWPATLGLLWISPKCRPLCTRCRSKKRCEDRCGMSLSIGWKQGVAIQKMLKTVLH